MTRRRRSESELVAVTNQYPRDVLEALGELTGLTHVPKAHHLREALQNYLEAHGRLSRPLWEFCGERVAVVISARPKSRSASLSEMYALIHLGDHLFPSQLDVYLSSDESWRRGAALADGFIVLGGPRQNRLSVDLLRRWEGLMPFQLKETRSSSNPTYGLHNWETGEKWVPDPARAERVPDHFSDFGLVVKAPTMSGDGTCVLLAGCHAFGTHAAARALSDPRSVAVIRRLLPAADAHFAAVVQVRVRNFCPEPPAVVDLTVISR